MKKDLEQIVRENKRRFDVEKPSNKIWEAIEKKMDKKPNKGFNKKVIYWMGWSAAALVILSFAGVFFYQSVILPNKEQQQISVSEYDGMGVKSEYPEFTTLAMFIEIKSKELETIKSDYPDLYLRFTTDMARLDSSFQGLRKELNGTPDNEIIFQAMIQNLQLQLDMLNQQLSIIQKIKNKQNESNASNI